MGLAPHGQFSVNPYGLLVIISLQILTYRLPEGRYLGYLIPKTQCQSQRGEKEFFGSRRNEYSSSNLLFKPLLIESNTQNCV